MRARTPRCVHLVEYEYIKILRLVNATLFATCFHLQTVVNNSLIVFEQRLSDANIESEQVDMRGRNHMILKEKN